MYSVTEAIGPESTQKARESRTLVIVSHYFGRERQSLEQLLAQLQNIEAGCAFDLLVVVNADDDGSGMPLRLAAERMKDFVVRALNGSNVISRDEPHKFRSDDTEVVQPTATSTVRRGPGLTRLMVRANTGMNIGAWDSAWRSQRSTYGFFLFMQDEVCLRRPLWLSAFETKWRDLEPQCSKRPILIGESINPRWDRTWTSLNASQAQRGALYRKLILAWGIDPTSSARHLRSLIWYSDSQSLSMIDGFRIGADKEQCIAAEIAASCQIRALGGRVEQLHNEPFYYLTHREWRLDGVSKRNPEAIEAQ